MQLGAESRNKTIAAISLMVLALIFVAVRFFPDSPAAAKSPTPCSFCCAHGTPECSATEAALARNSSCQH